MSLQGSLRTLSVPDLLSLLYQHKKTGLLSLVTRQDEMGILFQKGDIVYGTCFDGPRRLGVALANMGFVDPSEIARPGGSREIDTVAPFLGQELLQRGLLLPDQLKAAVRKQILEILDDAMFWKEGAFHFDEWFEPDTYPIPTAPVAGTRSILLEAMKRLDECDAIRKTYPDFSMVLQTSLRDPEAIQASGIDYKAQQVLELIDGTRSISQILRESPLTAHDTSIIIDGLAAGSHIHAVPRTRFPNDLPCIPEPWALPIARDVPARLYWLLRESTTTRRDIFSREIASDPVLVARLLRHMAAARIALPREKLGISRIVHMLGEFRVRAMLIPVVVRGTFFASREFYWSDCHRRSVACGRMCRKLAEAVGYPYREEAFLSGLLANLGIYVFIAAYPHRYRAVLDEARRGRSLCSLEETAFGASHAKIGAMMAERWKFPVPIVQAIRNHHQELERPLPLHDVLAVAGWASRRGEPDFESAGDDEGRVDAALKRLHLRRRKVLALSEAEADCVVEVT